MPSILNYSWNTVSSGLLNYFLIQHLDQRDPHFTVHLITVVNKLSNKWYFQNVFEGCFCEVTLQVQETYQHLRWSSLWQFFWQMKTPFSSFSKPKTESKFQWKYVETSSRPKNVLQMLSRWLAWLIQNWVLRTNSFIIW